MVLDVCLIFWSFFFWVLDDFVNGLMLVTVVIFQWLFYLVLVF